jgi:hypothetical protein
MKWVEHVARTGRREVCTGFWLGNLKEGDHWGDPGVDGRIILKRYVQEMGCGSLDWFELVQGRGRWWLLVNAVMNFRVQ